MILEMHLEANIVYTWRCTWKLISGGLRDALGGSNEASVKMRLEPVIEKDWKCASKP